MIGGIISRPPPVLAAIPNGIEVSAKKSRNGGINKISAGKQKGVTLWVAIGGVDTYDSKEKVPVHELSHGEPATQFHPRTKRQTTLPQRNHTTVDTNLERTASPPVRNETAYKTPKRVRQAHIWASSVQC